MEPGKRYASFLVKCMDEILRDEASAISQAAEFIAESVLMDGVLHIFGCGHSHMIAEEAFYRAGGFVPVNPIFDSAVMLHEGAVKSSAVEKMTGYAKLILDRYDIRPQDTMLVCSTSGINSLPIEMALEAKKRCSHVIGLTSLNYRDIPSRHPTGEHLYDVVSLCINNHVPVGDATLESEGVSGKIIPSSSILSMFILNTMLAQTAEEMEKRHATPCFFRSGNVPGGAEYNQKYIQQYRNRIKSL